MSSNEEEIDPDILALLGESEKKPKEAEEDSDSDDSDDSDDSENFHCSVCISPASLI